MTKARKKLKQPAGKPAKHSAKRPKLRSIRKPRRFLTRAEARRRAARQVLNRMFKGATVRDGVEAGGNFYGVRHADTWVVYNNPRGGALRSADVVVICKRSGRVLYEGSAGDEG